ncbi:hypothetical protein LguiA_009521 [Lonicera macranthoides]
MGNCQAIDNASLVIQHPCGRVDQLYWPIAASEVMKMNPGHYVALLLTTTLYPSTTSTGTGTGTASSSTITAPQRNNPVRITRIKLLRPTDTLALGHAYRLITTKEVMKGVCAKKYAKMKQKQSESSERPEMKKDNEASDFDSAETSSLLDKTNQGKKHEKQRTRTTTSSRAWHPSLMSITEATS